MANWSASRRQSCCQIALSRTSSSRCDCHCGEGSLHILFSTTGAPCKGKVRQVHTLLLGGKSPPEWTDSRPNLLKGPLNNHPPPHLSSNSPSDNTSTPPLLPPLPPPNRTQPPPPPPWEWGRMFSHHTYPSPWMGMTCSPLPRNIGNLPLPFFGGNYYIVLLDYVY